MADKTGIQWTDATWNPFVGCSLVSPACTNCYAMAMANRIQIMSRDKAAKEFMAGSSHYDGTTKTVNGKPVWTGVLKQAPEHIVTAPLRWRKPRRIFVNSMSDLFHEAVPDEWIDRAFAIMALSPQHTFQVLTKRPKRMREYFEGEADQTRRSKVNNTCFAVSQWLGGSFTDEQCRIRKWPLPNVWLGVTAEDQTRADERRDDMRALAAQGWSTFVSYEPALGPVDWARWYFVRQIIDGGETGPQARPSHPQWFRDTRDFCTPHGIAYFHKQSGEWLHKSQDVGPVSSWRSPTHEWPDGTKSYRVGKRRAGRLLDGVEHNAFPERQR